MFEAAPFERPCHGLNIVISNPNIPGLKAFPEIDSRLKEQVFRHLLREITLIEGLTVYCGTGLTEISREYLAHCRLNCVEIFESEKYLLDVNDKDGCCLVVSDFTGDSGLKDKMFGTSRNQGISLINDSFVGISGGSIVIGSNQALIGKLQNQFGMKSRQVIEITHEPNQYTNIFSNQNTPLIIHALGPWGTNISREADRAMRQLRPSGHSIIRLPEGLKDIKDIQRKIAENSPGSRCVILVYDGVEPDEYTLVANELGKSNPDVLNSCVMCCVYYKEGDMARIYAQNKHPFLAMITISPLDNMSLVSHKDFVFEKGQKIVTTSHPSPAILLEPLHLSTGQYKYKKATSNSAAALMVSGKQADYGIVTGSSITDAHEVIFSFGSPFMAFNFTLNATPEIIQQAQPTNLLKF